MRMNTSIFMAAGAVSTMSSLLLLMMMMTMMAGPCTGASYSSSGAKEIIHMAVLAPEKHPWFSSKFVMPAIQMAVETVARQGLLNDFQFSLSCRCGYDWSNYERFRLEAIQLVGDLDHGGPPDVIVGPVHAGFLSRAGITDLLPNTPIISMGGFGSLAPHSAGLTYMGPVNDVSNMVDVLIRILKFYGDTRRISLVYEDREQDKISNWVCWDEMLSALRMLKIVYNVDVSSFDLGGGLDPETLLHQVNADHSVVLLCVSPDSVKEMMIAAHDLHFDTRNNVFFNIDLFVSEDARTYPWYNESDTQERNERAARAFQALHTITLRKPASSSFLHFSREVKRRATYMYEDVVMEVEEVSSFVSAYHDAVILYALALNESLAKNIPIGDGRSISQHMREKSFQGISGTISINRQGNRLVDFSILRMDPKTRKNQVVANYFGASRTIQPVAGIPKYESTAKGDLLASEIPPTHCGFNGSNCVLGSKDVHIEISPSDVTEGQTAHLSCWTETHKEVLMIAILDHNNESLVFVRDGGRVTFTKNVSDTTMQANGVVSANNTKRSFLNVVIVSAKAEDGGEYTCIVYHMKTEGRVMQDRSTINMTVHDNANETISAESILSNLLDRTVQVEVHGELQPYWMIGMTGEEREVLTNVISNGKSPYSIFGKDSPDMKALLDRLARLESMVYAHNLMANDSFCGPNGCGNTSTHDLLQKVDTLEKESESNSQQLQQLVSKEKLTTAFHATFEGLNLAVNKGQTLVFSDLLSQQGQGFDPQTGVFTAPRSGVYGFHLSINNYGAGVAQIVLMANNRFFATLTTDKAHDKGQSHVSSAIDLKVGDQVKAVVADVQGQAVLRGDGYSTMTGYLIWGS